MKIYKDIEVKYNADVLIIGGGPAGMMAAISAAREGADVTILEHNDRIGKKILSTGNGRCNFTNVNQSSKYYRSDNKGFAWKVIECFPVEKTVDFFEELGIYAKNKNGGLYPYSEQASAILDVLRMEVERLKIKILTEENVIGIQCGKKVFLIQCKTNSYKADAVILAAGSKAASKLGSDGSGYQIAKKMGHSIIPVVPALVQLKCQENFYKALAGVRLQGTVRLVVNGKEMISDTGEIQLTDYGISGIPVFQMSRTAARALEQKKRVVVYIDFLPQMEEQDFQLYCVKKLQSFSPTLTMTIEEFLTGIGNKKLNHLFIKLANLSPGQPVFQIKKKELKRLLYSYKKLKVHVAAANSFENAQVTAGGVDLEEVDGNLESVKLPGLYFAGEMLDVDGRCGGYNLQWAWTSGWIAGEEAAGKAIRSGIAAFP